MRRSSNLLTLLALSCLSLLAQTRGASVSSNDFSGTGYTMYSLPALNVPSGNEIVGCFRSAGNGISVSVTDTAGNTFTVLQTVNFFNNQVSMFHADNATANSSDVVKITLGSSASFPAASAVLYSGVATAAYDSSTLASASSGSTAVPSLTSSSYSTSQGPEIIVSCASTFGNDNLAAGSISTSPVTTTSNAVSSPSTGILQIADANLFTIGSGLTTTVNVSGSDWTGMVSAGFKSSFTVSPPTVGQAFSSVSAVIQGTPYAYSGGMVTLSYTLQNPNPSTSLTSVAFSNTLPSGLVVATPNGLSGSCPSGTISAVAGSSTVSLSGAALTGTASCTFSVNLLTSGGAATVTNTPGAPSATQSGSGPTPASASLVLLGSATSSISNITVQAVDHASVNVVWNATPDASYCQLQYGTTSGIYQYSSASQPANYNSTNTCTMSLNGLTPSTAYYVMPTARPDANDTTGICYIGGACGTSEQTFTTLALPNPHPTAPAAPTIWTPTFPSLTGYTTVTMRANVSTGLCEAANNVAQQTNWSSGVTTGDSVQTVLNEIWYDTIIEAAEGSSCIVAQSGSNLQGPTIPSYSPPAGTNDWLVIQTHVNSASDFPPPGVRTGPQYLSKLWTLVAQTPNSNPVTLASIGGSDNLAAELFYCPQNGCNKVWIRNVAMTHTFSTCTYFTISCYPTGAVDPPIFGPFVGFLGHVGSSSVPSCPDTISACYTVIDRVYAYGQPYPSRELGCFEPGGNYWAIIDSYCSTNVSYPGIWPQVSPGASGATIYVPNGVFQLNAFDNTPIGMQTAAGFGGTSTTSLTVGTGMQTLTTQSGLSFTSGNLCEIASTAAQYVWMIGTVTSYSGTTLVCNILQVNDNGATGSSWILATPDIVTFSGANVGTYTGKVYAWLAPTTGLNIEYATASGVTASCHNCNLISVSSPAQTDVPANAFSIFNGQFNGAGNFVAYGYTGESLSPSQYTLFRPIGVYFSNGQYGLYDNNYMQAIGQTIYNDTEGPVEDIAWTHNYLYFPRSKMQFSGQWDGYGYSYRNVIETKQELRGLYQGNIVDGSASYQNPGNVLYVAGSWTGTYSTGTQDINVTGNMFKHISTGFQMAGGGTSPTDPPVALRIGITNNIFADLDRDLYQGLFSPGFASGAFSNYPMSGDVNFSNNTVGLTRGNGPAIFEFGNSSTFGEGLKMTNNVILTSLGFLDVFTSIDGGQNPTYSNFPTNPTAAAFENAPNPAGTWQSWLNAAWIHAGASSISSSWLVGNNVIVGAQCGNASPSLRSFCVGPGSWSDLTQAQINTNISSLWPAADTTSVFPCGSSDPFAKCGASNSLASRLGAIGWSALGANPSLLQGQGSGVPTLYTGPPTVYNAGNLGANPTLIMQQAGVVNNIVVSPASTAIGFTYTAPDSRACSVDISTDDNTWTRQTESGGALDRLLTFTGLSSSTLYYYRLMCYFDQSATYEFLAVADHLGTVTTSGTGSRSVTYSPIITSPATKVLLTYTPQTGSPTTNTCTATCATSLSAPGTYTLTVQPQTSGTISTGLPSTTVITVL